ncbi:glycosyltransferase family 4 protein [Patescibacteria group bacterium]
MKKKKVLVICNNLTRPAINMSGIAAIHVLLVELSKQQDLDIHVLSSLSSSSKPVVDTHNLTFHYVSGGNLLWIRILFFIKAIFLHRKFKFEIIHDYSSLPVLIGITGILAKLCKCKALHTICTINTSFFGSERFLFGARTVSHIICTDLITKKRLSEKTKNVTYIPLGIDTKKFQVQQQGILERPSILFLGSLEERKGAFVLADAIYHVVESYPQIMFIFASFGKEVRDPYYSKNLEDLKARTQSVSKNIKILTGWQNVAQLLNTASIFVLPAVSRHGTLGQPLTLIEAMSSKTPCIVSDIQKGDGLVGGDKNCLLFKSGNSKDLAEKITHILSNSDVANKLADTAYNTIMRDFDLQIVAKKVYNLYL